MFYKNKMNNKKYSFAVFTLATFFCFTLFFSASANAQQRDYLTTEEIELVRDAQEIDKRIDVLVKAIDRRFLVLNKDNSQAKQLEKDLDKWGELPKGDTPELLRDIEKLLQKAIDDIDTLVSNQEMTDKVTSDGSSTSNDEYSMMIIKTNKKQFPIAVHTLADAARGYIPMLKDLEAKTDSRKAKGSIYGALESCNLVIEASSKVPKYTKKDKKNKKDDN